MARVSVKVQRRGGKKLQRLLREAGKGGVSGVKVGFFSTAKYEDGTPVAAVAAWNEFGTETIPERPFFRRALAEAERGVSNILAKGIEPEKMVVDERLAGRVGAYVAGQVMESISALKEPPNAPETIARKGSTNPLIDTGMMRASVGWSVEESPVEYPRGRPGVRPPEQAPL